MDITFFSFFRGRGGGGLLRPVKIISIILSRVNHKVGQQQEIPEKKYLTTRKQNFFYLGFTTHQDYFTNSEPSQS